MMATDQFSSLPPMRDITWEQYCAGVTTLVRAARHNTSGGRASAQVLLSAYNGDAYHLNVVDLCLLDRENFAAAMAVIQGRAVLMREPQNCIEDGDREFQALWQQWQHLHTSQRYLED